LIPISDVDKAYAFWKNRLNYMALIKDDASERFWGTATPQLLNLISYT